jgi:hypothetical protein
VFSLLAGRAEDWSQARRPAPKSEGRAIWINVTSNLTAEWFARQIPADIDELLTGEAT